MKNLQQYGVIYFCLALWFVTSVIGMETLASHYGRPQMSIVEVDAACLVAKGFDQLIIHSNIVDEIPRAVDSAGLLYAVRKAFCQYKKYDMISGCAIELREAELLEILLRDNLSVYDTLLDKGLIKQPMQ